MLTFHLITLFPSSFESYLQDSIIGRAIKQGKIRVKFYNPRDFIPAKNKAGYTLVDQRSYGGGPGMVLMAEPILKAVTQAKKAITQTRARAKIIIFSPEGKQFTNQLGINLLNKKVRHLVLICGRYEGVDARVKKILRAEEWSIGPYILTGGELPALVVIDALARHCPGVLGKQESLEEGRVASGVVYTRPEVLIYKHKKYRVPPVLLSGHHARIEAWRRRQKKVNPRSVDKSIDTDK